MTRPSADAAELSFDINGLKLTIRGADELLGMALMHYVSAFAAHGPQSADYVVQLSRGIPEVPPDDAEIIFQGDLVPGVQTRIVTSAALGWMHVANMLSIRFTPSSAICVAAEACPASVAAMAMVNVMDAALAAAGQILLHGAALQLPSASAALLIFAPSGDGKTTTSLALALGGFRFMTDDAIVLLPAGGANGQPSAWGLPRALKVHRNTACLLPVMVPLLDRSYDRDGEQAVSLTALNDIVSVAPPQPIPVAATVVLGERTGGGHVLKKLAKTAALTMIAHDNVKRAPAGVGEHNLARFRAISTLIEQTRCFELCVGKDLRSLASAVRESIQAS